MNLHPENSLDEIKNTSEETQLSNDNAPAEIIEMEKIELPTHVQSNSEIENQLETETEQVLEEPIQNAESIEEPIIEVQNHHDAETDISKDDNIDELVTVVAQTEKSIQEEDDDETKMIDEEDDINVDYSSYNKDELLKFALDATKDKMPREAVKRIQLIRPFFDEILKKERQEKLTKFIEEGNNVDDFDAGDETIRKQFYEAYKNAQDARAEEKKRIELEKQNNLKAKYAIIENIKKLTESLETENSLEEIKKLQLEWKAIRAVPKQDLQDLYDKYHFYLDKFYDNFAINNELKDLDRRKNLDFKIELCKKVELLKEENSLKKSFILLNKHQEDFKNTGPVPKEFNQEIWDRFKSVVDEVYAIKKASFDVIQEKRIENQKQKEVLIEKARLIANYIPTKLSEWKINSDELSKIFDEWKTIGQVPKTHNEEIWQTFRNQFNTFYKNKNEYFKNISLERTKNQALKESICKTAEDLLTNEDSNFVTAELKKLQEEWKSIGPVAEQFSNELWKRFRTACDTFFEKKKQDYSSRKVEEENNLIQKQGIIKEAESLLTQESSEGIFDHLKDLQSRWNSFGFVPFKHKKEINDTYFGIVDQVYKKHKQNRDTFKKDQYREHYTNLSALPNGSQKLKDEERKIRDRIRLLKSDIETWENNMEFFAKSKNADSFIKDIQDKINKNKDLISKLIKEIEVIKGTSAA